MSQTKHNNKHRVFDQEKTMKIKHSTTIIFTLLLLAGTAVQARGDDHDRQRDRGYDTGTPMHYNYATAKKILRELYYRESNGRYSDYNRTIYCNCPILYRGRHMAGADFEECGYEIYKNPSRAYRIEWEHIVPAYNLGSQRRCWQKGGRRNCTRNDPIFSVMEGDMHNLQPSIGEVNEARSHYRYADAGLEPYQFGACDVVVDHKLRIMQPPESIRGIIARTYLYMYSKYNLAMSKKEARMYEIWDKSYPPTGWECHRNREIEKIQGNDNPYITRACSGRSRSPREHGRSH